MSIAQRHGGNGASRIVQLESPLAAIPVNEFLVTAQEYALAVDSSKRSKLYVLMAFGLAALLSSCAPALSQQDIENANYGAPITQARARQLAESYLSQVLLDPYSAHVQFGQVYRGYFNEALIYGGGARFGYILPATVNARNSFGGYVGNRRYTFYFFNGELELVYADEVMGSGYGRGIVHTRQWSRR